MILFSFPDSFCCSIYPSKAHCSSGSKIREFIIRCKVCSSQGFLLFSFKWICIRLTTTNIQIYKLFYFLKLQYQVMWLWFREWISSRIRAETRHILRIATLCCTRALSGSQIWWPWRYDGRKSYCANGIVFLERGVIILVKKFFSQGIQDVL